MWNDFSWSCLQKARYSLLKGQGDFFLDRHCVGKRKHVFFDCFTVLMSFLLSFMVKLLWGLGFARGKSCRKLVFNRMLSANIIEWLLALFCVSAKTLKTPLIHNKATLHEKVAKQRKTFGRRWPVKSPLCLGPGLAAQDGAGFLVSQGSPSSPPPPSVS